MTEDNPYDWTPQLYQIYEQQREGKDEPND